MSSSNPSQTPTTTTAASSSSAKKSKGRTVHLLDYVAGNIRSLVNAIEKCGWEVAWIREPGDVENAEVGLTLLYR